MKQRKIDDKELQKVSGAGPNPQSPKHPPQKDAARDGGGNTGIDSDNEGSDGSSSVGQG